MPLMSVRIVLRGWKPGAVTGEEFFGALGLKPEDGFFAESGAPSPGRSAKVILASAEHERENSCDQQVGDQLRRAAGWLSSRPSGVFDSLRAQGLKMDVFVSGWIDNDQMDLGLPPEFLLACGQAGLGIKICTND